ncbi:hypothetical protein GCM10010254_75180 [Streptomyces chromofuscus]|nr:hypothetical protein GCM10010254_75180 [Streptomyces chromofuscus]
MRRDVHRSDRPVGPLRWATNGAAAPITGRASPLGSQRRRNSLCRTQCEPTRRLRLTTAVLAALHDEWIVFPRRYLSNDSMGALYADSPTVLPAASDD